MNPKSFSVYLGLIFLLLGTNNLSAQQKFEFKMQKEKNFYSLKNYRLSPGGKYLLAQLSGSERDSLLVIDIINKKSIKLNGLHGAVQSYDLIPEQNLILVHTGEYSSSQTSLQCFIYDGLTLELKKVVLVGKAKQDTTKRNSSWLQPQDTGYQKLLGVEGNSMFFINHLSQVSKYNMLSGEGEILFTVNKQPDDFINSSISTIHKGILTSVIYDKQQKGKILWYNSNNKVQKLTDLPDGYTLSDFAVYQDSVKWYLAKKEKEQSLLIGLDISNGAVLFKENLSKYASKLAVSQQSGDLIFAHYGTGRLLKNVGKGTYKELDKDIEVGNSFLFSKSENSLIVADSYKLWKYNLSLSNEEFSISVQTDSKDQETFLDVVQVPGQDEAFYVVEAEKYFKFSSVTFRSSSPVPKPPVEQSVPRPTIAKQKPVHLVIQDGHRAKPSDISFSKSKGWMVSGDQSGTIIFWDLKSKMQIKSFQITGDENSNPNDGSLLHLALHPFNDILAVSWNENSVIWFDFDGQVIKRFKTDSQSTVVHFSEDGKYFFYQKRAEELSVMNTLTNDIQSAYQFNTIHHIKNFAFSGDSRKLALPSANGDVVILNALNGEVLNAVRTANTRKINLVAFHPDLDVIATLGTPLEVCLTNIATGKSNVVLTGKENGLMGIVTSVFFNRANEIVLAGTMGAKIDNGAINNLFSAQYDSKTNYTRDWGLYRNTNEIQYITGAIPDVEGKTVWSLGANNAIEIWDIEGKSHLQTKKGNSEHITDVSVGKAFTGLVLGINGDEQDYLKRLDFANAGFSVFDGLKYGTENLYEHVNGHYSSSFASSVKRADLNSDSLIVNDNGNIIRTIVGSTPFGYVSYSGSKLTLISADGKSEKVLHEFNRKEDKHYYWAKENLGKTHVFDEGHQRLFLFDYEKFWCIDLSSGTKVIYSIPGVLKQLNTFLVHGNDLIIAAKNTLYLYHLSDGNHENLSNVLKHQAVFSNSTFPPVMGRSRSNQLAISYALDTLAENGSSTQKVEVFTLKQNRSQEINAVRKEPVLKLLFSTDEKYLFVVYKKQIDIISLHENTLTATYATIPGGKYILYTPDNYYFASPKFSGVGFNVNDRIFDVTQFDLKFNRPDIVLERIGLADKGLIETYKKAYEKRLGRLGMTPANLVIAQTLPEVTLLNKTQLDLITSISSIELNLKIKKGSNALGRLYITVNDVPVNGTSGLKLDNTEGEVSLKPNLRLVSGINSIKVFVTDVSGFESLKEIAEVSYSPKEPQLSRVFYIGIGISKYQDSSRNLKYADKDILDLGKVFTNRYQAINKVLLNADATRDAFYRLKENLFKTTEEDIVIVSLSGHGLVNKTGDFYFASHNTDFDNPESNGIKFEDLKWLLDSIPARKKLLMIDACHSGELDKGVNILGIKPMEQGVKERKGVVVTVTDKSIGLQNSYELMKELFTDLSKSNGAEVISAAGGLEYAFENERFANGVFTYSLKKAFEDKAADENGDNQITINELKTYMVREVFRLTGGRQKPTIRQEAVSFNWRVW